MTFSPDQPVGAPASRTVRTILFWLLMVMLAIILFKMAPNPAKSKDVRILSYSEFLQEIDRNNVSSVKYYLAQNTAEIEGELHQPVERFRVTVPKEAVPDLTNQLRKQGARIEVSSSAPANWQTFILNFAPLFLLVAFWVFMMKRYRPNQRQS